MKNTKKAYSAPKLTVHGDVEAVTQKVSKTAENLDATFPSGTPRGLLTFS